MEDKQRTPCTLASRLKAHSVTTKAKHTVAADLWSSMPVSFEAIDAEWLAYEKNGFTRKSSDSQRATPEARRVVTPRIVVEARDVVESDGRNRSSQSRSQSASRGGQQKSSHHRSRTQSPLQRRDEPKATEALTIVVEENSRKIVEVRKSPTSAKSKASERHAMTTSAEPKQGGARIPAPVGESPTLRDLGKAHSFKTTHHSNMEERGSSTPVSQNNMYTTPRLTSSSLTSTASAQREDAHAASVLRKQKQHLKYMTPVKVLDESNAKNFQRAPDKALIKKQRQSQRRKAGLSSHRSDISLTEPYLRTPRSVSESSITASPNIIYQALRTGNSSALSQCLESPHNLNDALRGSASDASVFQDFHNPNVQYDPLPSPTTPSRRSGAQSSSHADDAVSVLTPSSGALQQRLALKSESRSFDSVEEMSYYHYVSRHSVLQLCTEDLMSDNWKLVDYALYRLCEVCCSVDASSDDDQKSAADNRIRFIKAGGHAMIVGVMKKYSSVADLQTSACRLVQNLVALDHHGAFNELFASVYGMDRVLAAIQRFPPTTDKEEEEEDEENDEVYRYACGALVAIVCSNFKMVLRLLRVQGNLTLFLAAMHADRNKRAIGVCRVLNFVSKQPEHHAEVVNAGGLEQIADEMKLHPTDKDVQICGCEALGNMVKESKSDEIVERIVNRMEGAHLIGNAMKAFPDLEVLHESATYALYHFSAHRGVKASIKQAAGLSALGIALETFPTNEKIQERGCATMKRLLEANISAPE